MAEWKKVLTATTSGTDLVGSAGSNGQVLQTNGSDVLSWVDQSTGTTDLGINQDGDGVEITSSSGDNVTIGAATSSQWGVLKDDDWSTFNSKQAAITGAASTITSSDLTVSRALLSNVSGKVAVSATTAVELSYLQGVSSAIQTQLDAKQGTLTFGIANSNAVDIDSSTVTDGEYARFTANGLESRSNAEVLSDIGAQASGSYAALAGSTSQNFSADTLTLGNDLKLDGQGSLLYNTAGTAGTDDIFDIGPGQATGAKNLRFTYSAIGTVPKTQFYGFLESGASGAVIKGFPDGNLNLHTDVDCVIRLDVDQDSNGKFIVKNGGGTSVFEVDESGNVQLDGDLTVSGSTITTETEIIEVNNNTIVLNANLSTSTDVDAGFVVERGSSVDNALFYWDEGEDKWMIGTNDNADLSTTPTYGADVMQVRIDNGYNNASEEVPVGHMQYHNGILYLRTS
mgnify:CR=1 FL=1